MATQGRFTADFKAKLALGALRGDKTIQEIAAKHKVHPNQVSTWKRQTANGRALPPSQRLEKSSACQSALNLDPLSASNIDPSCGIEEVVPVVHRGDPRGFVSRFSVTRSEDAWGVPVDPPGQPGRRCARADLRAVLEAPALVSGLQDVAVVGQTVEQGGCHFRVNEDLWPFLEGQVCCDDYRGSLVEPADEMEQ